MSIFTVRYNQTTIFFFFFNFLNVIFFIKNQFLSKSAFVTEENNLFFGMHSPEPSATKSLASTGILPRILNVCSKNWLMTVVLERCFCYWGEQPFLWYVSFSTFCSLKSSVCWFPQEILTVISSHRKFHTKIVQGSTRILSEILSAYCKTKTVVKQKSAGEEELVWWKQQKKAAKLSFPL